MRSCALLLPLVLLSCKSDPPPTPLLMPTSTAATSAVDHVDPNEIPEGTERAFGLPLPRAMRVSATFPDAVRATGELPLAALTAFVRSRVIAERVEAGPEKAVFSNATLKSAPGKLLRVEIVAYDDRSELIVRDVTQPPASDTVKPTDPWYKPGFDPKDGKADPTRFE